MPAALHYLGLDPNSTKPDDLERAADLLGKIRPSVRKFHSSEYINALASGEICLVVGWSGDIKQAKNRATRGQERRRDRLCDPEGGRADVVRCNLAIPKDAPHPAEALAFINFMLDPQVAAKNSNLVAYANGNLASQKFIDKAVLDDPGIYPDAATIAKLYTVRAWAPAPAAADQPAVDAGEDGAVITRKAWRRLPAASGGAATATVRAFRGSSLRSRS